MHGHVYGYVRGCMYVWCRRPSRLRATRTSTRQKCGCFELVRTEPSRDKSLCLLVKLLRSKPILDNVLVKPSAPPRASETIIYIFVLTQITDTCTTAATGKAEPLPKSRKATPSRCWTSAVSSSRSHPNLHMHLPPRVHTYTDVAGYGRGYLDSLCER